MSVTRNIKANEATQVNSNLIGVQVHPEVGTINMNYIWNVGSTRNPGQSTSAIISVLFTGESVEYAYTAAAQSGMPDGIQVEPGGPQYYNFRGYNTAASTKKSSIWLTSSRNMTEITDTNVYEVTSEVVEGETVYTVSVIGTVIGYAFGVEATDSLPQKVGTFLEVSSGNFRMLTEGGSDDGYRYDSRNYYFYDNQDNFYGVSRWGTSVNNQVTLSAERQSVSSWEGKYEWIGTPMVRNNPANPNYQNISVWTDVEEPGVGDVVYYAKNDTEFNVMTVTSTEPGAVSCSVEFSVDGASWTQVGDTLTDNNNVIANVPRYVYLRFGQDVEITEE